MGVIVPDEATTQGWGIDDEARDDDDERPEPSVHATRGIGQFRHGRNIPDGFSRVPLEIGGAHPDGSGLTRSLIRRQTLNP
jgi:hypothetical protein